MSRWNPVTETDPKPDPLLIEFSLTPQERDIAILAKVDVLARARQFGQFTPGLVVTELTVDDLTDSEKSAFGFGGAA